METIDILIIGGGAAGIAAAKGAYAVGCKSMRIIERGDALGGVLLQCAHRGFGGEMTGMEYACDLIGTLPKEIAIATGTTVVSIGEDRTCVVSSKERGLEKIAFRRLILAVGCREIPIGALNIAGTRPKGIYTAGQMQAMINLDGFRPKGPVVILGSGDLGLIVADHIADMGIGVTMVEQNARCGGIARNRRRILSGEIELICEQTIVEVIGKERITGVLLTNGAILPCSTLLTSVGLVPDRELVDGLGQPDWLFSCGNCRKTHAVIESVIAEGEQTGKTAFNTIRGIL